MKWFLILHSEAEHLGRSVFDSLIGVACLSSHVWLALFSGEPMEQEVGFFMESQGGLHIQLWQILDT